MTERKRATGSDLKKADEYAPTERDYEEVPELTDAWFARAKWHKGGVPMPRGPRGRPKSKNPKAATSLRLDADVLAHFRKSGPGWQSRINAILRKAAKLPGRPRKKA
jgi:uncharacterized protein (DUF4415 family)